MAKRNLYADLVKREKLPVVNGEQYRAVDTGKAEKPCDTCAAKKDDALCKALPPCFMGDRTDGLNVNYVYCGKAAAAPVIRTEKNGRGGVRFDHDAFKVGTRCLHAGTGEEVEVVDDGMAGMPEVKFADGHTIFAFPQDLKPVLKGGAS